MKISLYLIILLLLVVNAATQTKPVTTTSAKAGPAPAKPTFSNASDSLKFAIKDFKNSMNTLFGSKKDTIAFVISNVDYDDANLESLKSNLKNLKGVKLLGIQYKGAVAKIDLSYKGKPTDLWDELPAETRKPFKLVEASDNNLLLTNRGKQ